jgi:hypothetical protein
MIFKWRPDATVKPYELPDEIKIQFKLGDVFNSLVYPEYKEKIKSIEAEEGGRFFPDQVASLYRRLFIKGFGHRKFLRNALYMVEYFLAEENFELRFYLSNENVLNEKGDDSQETRHRKHSYYNKNEFEGKGSWQEVQNRKVTSDVIDTFTDKSLEVFFVFGCQNATMLDNRMHIASTVISDILLENPEAVSRCRVILSGWNNSGSTLKGKVQFANESQMMVHLLNNKIRYFMKLYGPKEEINEDPNEPEKDITESLIATSVFTEIESGNTKANIKGLFKKLKNEILKNNDEEVKNADQINLYLISSSSHLLEIYDKFYEYLNGQAPPSPWKGDKKDKGMIKKSKENLIQEIGPKPCTLYLIGAENPMHPFTNEQEHEVKLLINNVIYKSFNLPKNEIIESTESKN